MRLEKDIKANKKLTVIFSIIIILAIISTVARQLGRKKVQEVDGDFGDAEFADSLTVLPERLTLPVSTLVVHEDWGIDPFTSIEERKRTVNSGETSKVFPLKLSGILNDGVRARAVINGKVYTSGSRISDYVIECISSDGVMLRKGNTKILLTL